MQTSLQELNFPDEYFIDEIRNGFYVSETMKRFWAAQLQVLSEIDKICRRHNLSWYADCGTLLGAVRHKGFVPWDDDLDIALMRDDYEQLLKYAREELPEEYYLFSFIDRDDYVLPFARIVNSGELRTDKEFLEKNFGCPFSVGVDIYPLDNVFDDPDKEEDRKARAEVIMTTFKKTVNITGDAPKEMMVIFDKVSRECTDNSSKEITRMYLYAEGFAKYQRSYYDSWEDAPFETTMIRVPAGAKDILHDHFGDYTIFFRGGAVHDYPGYRQMEDIIEANYHRYPTRYCFDPQNFAPKSEREIPVKPQKDILFLSCRSDWWDQMSPVFEAAKANPDNKVSVIPIPYYFLNSIGEMGAANRDTQAFEAIEQVRDYLTNFDEYDLEARHPDIIVIQFPFDGYSRAIRISPFLYSGNLSDFTDQLVYVPYLNPDVPTGPEDVLYKAMTELIEQPAVFNADRVIVSSEGIRQVYIEQLTAMTGEDMRSYWEKRIRLEFQG